MILLLVLSFYSCNCVDGLTVRERKLWPPKNSQFTSVTIVKSRERKHENKNATQLRLFHDCLPLDTPAQLQTYWRMAGIFPVLFRLQGSTLKVLGNGTGFYLLEGSEEEDNFYRVWIGQFRYSQIQLWTRYLSTRLRGIKIQCLKSFFLGASSWGRLFSYILIFKISKLAYSFKKNNAFSTFMR